MMHEYKFLIFEEMIRKKAGRSLRRVGTTNNQADENQPTKFLIDHSCIQNDGINIKGFFISFSFFGLN